VPVEPGLMSRLVPHFVPLTDFVVGARWRLHGVYGFDVDAVILGPGKRSGYKRCRLEVPAYARDRWRAREIHRREVEFSHKFLRKFGTKLSPKRENSRREERS
jgi:hypothetical protein